MKPTTAEILALLPLLVPAVASLVALLIAGLSPGDRKWGPLVVAVGALAGVAVLLLRSWPASAAAVPIFGGMLAMDVYTVFFGFLILALLAGTTALALPSLRSKDFAHGEFWALLLFAACGMLLLAAATNLLLIFLAVEIMSISVYALVGSDRAKVRPPEAALKYFLLGAFSSAFLLFGIAFIYGATGEFGLSAIAGEIHGGLRTAESTELMLGMSFMLVGFLFKTSAVPFHMWTPDAYTGAPTPVTAFMASAVKAASFAAFVRVFAATLGPNAIYWSHLVAVAAGLTVVVGNFGAIAQTELKRMLAYSGIAHAGYVLIGIRAASIDPGGATPTVLFYLLAYTFTTLGAFGVVVALERLRGREIKLDDLAGLSAKHPVLAAALAVFMLALAGVPPTAGFTAKLYVFGAAVRVGDYFLAVLGVIASAVSLFYYLRVVVLMYMQDKPAVATPESPLAEPNARMPSIYGVVAMSVIVVILAGVSPDWYFRLSRVAAAASLRVTMPDASISGRLP